MSKKILHLCLASFYIDGFSYQENLLPKYHKKMGYDVEIIASLFTFDENGKASYLEKLKPYVNEDGIKVTRLEYKKSVFGKILRRYQGTYDAIIESKPDIIFIHGSQFLDIDKVVKYHKKYPNTKIYVDNHADFSNSARNFLSKNILHKIIWRKCAQLIEPYTTKFYGVLPARVKFLNNMYGIPKEKIELLVMGADDEKVIEAEKIAVKNSIRKKYNINKSDFLIVTGGKIDNAKKQTLLLMQAVQKISDEKVKLIVFGSVIPELKDEITKLIDGNKVQYVGWVESDESYDYFAAADLVVFPGRHSVFWEQVVGQGIPMIVKWWEGTTHIDIGGNVVFLYEDSSDEIQDQIYELLNDKATYNQMNKVAKSNKKKDFLYTEIARKSLL